MIINMWKLYNDNLTMNDSTKFKLVKMNAFGFSGGYKNILKVKEFQNTNKEVCIYQDAYFSEDKYNKLMEYGNFSNIIDNDIPDNEIILLVIDTPKKNSEHVECDMVTGRPLPLPNTTSYDITSLLDPNCSCKVREVSINTNKFYLGRK